MSNVDPVALSRDIERLVQELDESADPPVRARSRELVRLLLELYGAGLARMLDIVRTERGGADAVLDRFAGDGLVGSLLVLHDLHPHPVARRIETALAGILAHVQPVTAVAIVGVEDETVRLRVESPAPLSRMQADITRGAIERAVQEVAPEIAVIQMEGLAEPGAEPLIQILRKPAPAVRP